MGKMYQNLKKEKANVENCILCAIYPLHKLAFLTGTSAINLTCPWHTEKNKLGPLFVVSPYKVLFGVVLLLLLILLLVFRVDMIMKARDKLTVLGLIVEVIYCLNGIQILTTEMLLSQKKVSILKLWNASLQDCKLYHVDALLPGEELKKIRKICWVFCLLIVTSSVCLLYTTTDVDASKCYWKIVIICGSVVTNAVHMTVASQLIVYGITFRSILYVWQDKLKTMLTEHLSHSNKTISLERRIASMKRMYTIFSSIMLKTSQYMSPGGVIWFLAMVVVLIMNIYILIMFWATNIYDAFTVVLEVKTYGIIVIIVVFAVCSHKIEDVAGNILTFLYKYPISKLTPAEAAQVEALITTLTFQKLEIRISDMFTVDTKLLASISGTIVTYVLVELQFLSS